MIKKKHLLKSILSSLLCLCLLTSTTVMSASAYTAENNSAIAYQFTGTDADTPGYAEGTITFTPADEGKYNLYWADDEKALEGYYEIDSMTLAAGETGTFEFDYHTAIPADAKKIIAVKADDTGDFAEYPSVADAYSVYDVPENKQLPYSPEDSLYTFNSYSDIHIDAGDFYVNASKHWEAALKYASDKGTDFIVTSGDSVTNASGPKKEWDIYEQILADSDYDNPVYESNGNHDMRTGVQSGNKEFVRASGTDNTKENYDANKPYYYVTEPTTGDMFIFMALENSSDPSSCDEFSEEQLEWVSKLLAENYGKGYNIYLIQHSPINGYGAGDDMDNPYYKAHLSTSNITTVRFKALMDKYPNIIWMSGHTHEDFNMGYNYSNEDGTACNMIHNPSVAGPTHPSSSSHSLDYTFYDGLSQGYYVEVYDGNVIYYGANLCDEKIYPAYSYIMQGSRHSSIEETNATTQATTSGTTAVTGSTLPDGVETVTYYYVNTTKWESVDCYGWSDADTSTCVWPGYGCSYCSTDEYGNDIYCAEVPASFQYIIFNNAGNKKQTVDITLDGTNNCFTPDGTTTSGKYNVTASLFNGGELPTEPSESTEPTDSTEPTATEETTPESTETTAEIVETEPSTVKGESTPDEITDSSDNPEISALSNINLSESSVNFLYGDVTKDGIVSVKDVSLVQKYIAELEAFDDDQIKAADVDGNEAVNAVDATNIQKYLADFFTRFPIEKADENILSAVEKVLADYYSFSSYDQYQNLKKLYRSYKDINFAEDTDENYQSYLELKDAMDNLTDIADYIKGKTTQGYDKDLVIYFAAPEEWLTSKYTVKSNICFDAGDNVWGQRNMIQTTDKFGGLAVFRYTYKADEFYSENIDKLQFQAYNGSAWQTQFVAVNDTTMYESINGMLYDSTTQKWVDYTPAPGTIDVIEPAEADYALCYYSETHSWDDRNSYFTKKNDGTYTFTYVADSAPSIRCNVFDLVNNEFNCVAASTSLTIAGDVEVSETYSLSASASRGKSITIKGLTEGMKINFVYHPDTNTVDVNYVPAGEEKDNEHYVLCYYATDEHAWDARDTFFEEQDNGTYALEFTTISSNNISCNVFDMVKSEFNCVAASTSLTITADTETSETYSLSASTSRGKSITIKGLSEGMKLSFVYNPETNTLNVSYVPAETESVAA